MTEISVSKELHICPVCGVDLTGLNLFGHMLSHYPEFLDPAKSSALAIKCQKLLLAGGVTPDQFKKLHNVEG